MGTRAKFRAPGRPGDHDALLRGGLQYFPEHALQLPLDSSGRRPPSPFLGHVPELRLLSLVRKTSSARGCYRGPGMAALI